jgi:hypothetical protein
MDTSGIKTGFLRVSAVVAALLMGTGACQAEVTCFKTAAQAAVQVGEQDGGGYRLEFVRRDGISGRNWASVRSCAHPEWPAVVVVTGAAPVAPSQPGRNEAVAKAVPVPPPVVTGGRTVRVVLMDAVSKLEMTGITQGSGRLGDVVRVRILAPGDGGEGRVVEAVVRSADMVEMGR